MALNLRLQHLLDRSSVPYEIIPHRDANTAMGVAHTAHVAGRQIAKPVIVRDQYGMHFMLVLPAMQHFDRHALRRMTGRDGVHLEDERQLATLFPDCELGAMPPFGILYDMPTFVDRCLAKEEDIYFQAGNHHELVRMRFEDYERLAKPIVEGICLHAEAVGVGG